MIEGPGFARRQTRDGKVPRSTKFWQAVGSWPDTFKNFAFNTFLLFYYNQLLGMPATLVSAALAIALIIDAITDPMVGYLSDNLRSPMGRRHPLMYGSALPLGFSLWLVFSPPAESSDTFLFLWLLATTVAVRVTLTFFLVPWNAMFAEFSDDYEERTEILTWRHALGWIGGLSFTMATWTFIFPSTETHEFGQFDLEAYASFGPVLGVLVAASVLCTTHMTRRDVPYLFQPVGTPERGPREAVHEILLALGNRNFLRLFLAILIGAVVAGTNEALGLFMGTYFWGMRPEDLRWFGFAVIGALLAFAIVPTLQHRFDKKPIVIAGLVFNLINGVMMVSLRMLDWLPPNGDPLLLPILVTVVGIRACIGTVVGILFGSMIADLLDDQELRTGRRQEGVFSAALAFSGKLTGAVGVVIGGLVLDHLVGIPTGTEPAAADASAVLRLGVIDGLVMPSISVVGIWLASHYTITRARHSEIRAALELRRAERDPESSGATRPME
jgi:Na+/melibiose symporter-like transporter